MREPTKPPRGLLFAYRLDPARADSRWGWKINVWRIAAVKHIPYRSYATEGTALAAGSRTAVRLGIQLEELVR